MQRRVGGKLSHTNRKDAPIMATATAEDTTNGKETHSNNDIGKSFGKPSGKHSGKTGKSGNIACPHPTPIQAGSPQTPATRHDFRQYSGNVPATMPVIALAGTVDVGLFCPHAIDTTHQSPPKCGG